MVPDKEGLLREACQFFLCAFAISVRRRASSVSIPFFRSRAAATALCLVVPVAPSCDMVLLDIRPPLVHSSPLAVFPPTGQRGDLGFRFAELFVEPLFVQ